jgi:hypothetical protein
MLLTRPNQHPVPPPSPIPYITPFIFSLFACRNNTLSSSHKKQTFTPLRGATSLHVRISFIF